MYLCFRIDDGLIISKKKTVLVNCAPNFEPNWQFYESETRDGDGDGDDF